MFQVTVKWHAMGCMLILALTIRAGAGEHNEVRLARQQ